MLLVVDNAVACPFRADGYCLARSHMERGARIADKLCRWERCPLRHAPVIVRYEERKADR
jgi:hypothetical protein